MNTILAAQMISSGSGSGNPTSVRQGAYQTPFTKALSQNTAAVFPAELKPVTTVKVASQGSTDQFVIFSHYGPCPLVPDNNNTPGMTPYSTTQMRDDFNLPIAGAPAPGQKALMFQTAAGNPIALGTTSTSPDGITTPQIPNTGDVTPGTASSNPSAVASGPVTKQHPWITDIVTHWGLFQVAYGRYDFIDPTGTVHTSLGKGDKKVKKPQINVLLHAAAVNTGSPGSTVSVPGYPSTLYNLSGMTFDNTTFGVRVADGYALSRNPSTLDFTIRTSATLPATDTGDQTARQFPGHAGTTYNTSALDYDAITKAAYVKIDGTTIKQTAAGELMSVGGGGGGGTGSPVAMSAGRANRLDTSARPIFAGSDSTVIWRGGLVVDHGGWATAGTTDPGPSIVVPATGTYGFAFDCMPDSTIGAADITYDVMVNGTSVYTVTDDIGNALAFTIVLDLVAADVVQIRITNDTTHDFDLDIDGSINLWLIQSQPSTVLFAAKSDGSMSNIAAYASYAGRAAIPWAAPDIDEGGWVTAGSTGTSIILPVTGKYTFSYSIGLSPVGTPSSGDSITALLGVAGFIGYSQTWYADGPSPTGIGTPTFTYAFSGTAGDTVKVYLENDAAWAVSANSQTYILLEKA